MKRLFAAMLLPAEIIEHLDERIDAVRSARPDLRWSPQSRWHLTLQFLGECGPHEVDRQLERWERRARRGRPMQLNLQGAGTFPKTFIARALWIGLGGEVDAWHQVAAFDQQPHVTIARSRERIDLTGVVLELESYRGPTWTAEYISVVESRLNATGDNGPRYQSLEVFPLGAAAEPSDPG